MSARFPILGAPPILAAIPHPSVMYRNLRSRPSAEGPSRPLPLLILLLLSAGLWTCGESDLPGTDDDPSWRGEIISWEKVESWDIDQVDSLTAALGITVIPENGIDIYTVVYRTPDARGVDQTTASGALIVPTGVDGPFPLSGYQHGTIVLKDDVPSTGSVERNIGIIFSATGYITAMPDYLGLGQSPGLHPYVHAKSEATASVDMLRASRRVLEEIGVSDNGQLFLFGYSQGGHATMALLQEIEARHAEEFPITAAAPMSGPYDLAGAQTDMLLSGEPYSAPFYLPYLLLAYNEVYGMYDSPSDFFKEPWASTLPPLFNGMNNYDVLNAAVPATPLDILREEVLDDFLNNPDNPFRVALEDNTQLDRAPQSPTRLYYCTGDEQVHFQNAVNARQAYLELGVDIPALNSESLAGGAPLSHGGCVEPSLLNCRGWFESLRE
jgi:pimeloyl-ACP methyl ester carboxylesterase